jgi:hypothetical protein
VKDLFVAHWWKAVIGVVVVSVISWGAWVTRMCQKAEKSEEILDTQVGILHNRITGTQMQEEADETRLENRLWELQKRFYECEIEKIKESK